MSGILKKSQYKGTPHPRKRKPLEAITNKQNVAASGKKIDDSSKNSSPLKRLHLIHGSVARLLEKIDSLVTGIHKKKLSEKLAPEEIDNFSRAMSAVEGTLQEWHAFFLQVDKRSHAPQRTVESRYSHHDVNNDDLIPIVPSIQRNMDGALSDSPLVSAARNESRKTLRFTPELSLSSSRSRKVTPVASSIKKVRFGPLTPSASNSKRVTFASTRPAISPAMPSPPRSVRLRRPSMSSSSSCPSTPSFLNPTANTPSSMELTTPQAPAEIVNRYPKWFSKAPPAKQAEQSPGMGISPPKTCTLLTPIESSRDQDLKSPTALLTSPFRTPGLVLRSPSFEESPVSEQGSIEICSRLAAASL